MHMRLFLNVPSTWHNQGLPHRYVAARVNCTFDMYSKHTWAAQSDTWLLMQLMPKGVVLPFLVYSKQNPSLQHYIQVHAELGEDTSVGTRAVGRHHHD